MIFGDDFYKDIELTDEEIEAALLEWKKRKFFKQKADLKEQEDGMHQLREPKDRKQRPDVMRYVQQPTQENGQGESSRPEADQESIKGISKRKGSVCKDSAKVP
jgi:hypothetical protein